MGLSGKAPPLYHWGKSPQYLLDSRLGEPLNRSGLCEEKSLVPDGNVVDVSHIFFAPIFKIDLSRVIKCFVCAYVGFGEADTRVLMIPVLVHPSPFVC
jgi:hypothetical protein